MKNLVYCCLTLLILSTVPACSHKAACGNTKKVVKSKTKSLKKNKHFNMM